MKFFNALLLLMIVININSISQTTNATQPKLTPFDRHNGIVFEDQLIITYNENQNSFEYTKDCRGCVVTKDGTKEMFKPLNTGDLFNIKGDDDSKYVIYFKFYNPLRIKLAITEENIEDPSTADINSFISVIHAQFPLITAASSATGVYTANAELIKGLSTNLIHSTSTEDNLILTSSNLIISEWMYELGLYIDTNLIYSKTKEKELKRKSYTQEFDSLINDLNKIGAVNRYLYGKIKIGAEEKNLNDWVLFAQSLMYEKKSKSEFQSALDTITKIQDALLKAQTASKDSLTFIFTLLINDFDSRIKPFLKDDAKKNPPGSIYSLKTYSIPYCSWISMTIDERKKNTDLALKNLVNSVKNLKLFYSLFDEKGYVKIDYSQLIRNSGLRQIDITAKQLDTLGNEKGDKNKAVSFILSRWNSAYPFASTGFIFTNFQFPTYTMSFDSVKKATTVQSGIVGPAAIQASPVLFLNYVFNVRSDYFYPVIQFGLATINKSILIPIGLGVGISDRFTISGGLLTGLIKDLNKLKVGQTITSQADIDNDLTYRLFNSGYFGINYNFK